MIVNKESPAYLCNNMASDKDLFFREEAMFILDSLIEAKKCCKQHVKFESYISAIALNAYSRVEVSGLHLSLLNLTLVSGTPAGWPNDCFGVQPTFRQVSEGKGMDRRSAHAFKF